MIPSLEDDIKVGNKFYRIIDILENGELYCFNHDYEDKKHYTFDKKEVELVVLSPNEDGFNLDMTLEKYD